MWGDIDALSAAVILAVSLMTLIGTIRVTQIIVHAVERGRSARALLDRRLARGEISTEEYYELESALRSSQPVSPRRRLLRG